MGHWHIAGGREGRWTCWLEFFRPVLARCRANQTEPVQEHLRVQHCQISHNEYQLTFSRSRTTRYIARHMPPPRWAVRLGHIDGASTWRMLLTRHRWRLRCRSTTSVATLTSGFNFQQGGFLLVFHSNRKPERHRCWAVWLYENCFPVFTALPVGERSTLMSGSVCLSDRTHILRSICPNLTRFSVHVIYGRCSDILLGSHT